MDTNADFSIYTPVGRVSAVSGPHPDLPQIAAHWVENAGMPRRMSQGGVDTYPNRHCAIFAAKTLARRLQRENAIGCPEAVCAKST